MLHVPISVAVAILMQTPGVSLGAIDAAGLINRPMVSVRRTPMSVVRTGDLRACPCPNARHAS
jgi:hypothetical protein